MKDKHLAVRIQQCLALAEASNCPRRTFGALLVDPKRNVVLMDGYNGQLFTFAVNASIWSGHQTAGA